MKTKRKTKLEWKLKWCDDNSGCWYSAKVPVLGWEYIIDVGGYYEEDADLFIENHEYEPRIFYTKYDDDCTNFTKKDVYFSLDSAKAACEKHLNNMAEKFNKWLNQNDVDLISDQELKKLVDKSKRSAKIKK